MIVGEARGGAFGACFCAPCPCPSPRLGQQQDVQRACILVSGEALPSNPPHTTHTTTTHKHRQAAKTQRLHHHHRAYALVQSKPPQATMASAKSKSDILKRYLSSSTSESNGRWGRGRVEENGREGASMEGGHRGGRRPVENMPSFPTHPHTPHASHKHDRGHEDEEEAQEAAGGRDGRHAHGGPGRMGWGGAGRQR